MLNLKIFCCRRSNCFKEHRGRSPWNKDSSPIHWRWPALDIQVIRTLDQKFRKTNYPYYTCSQIEGDSLYSWYKRGIITPGSYFEILDYTIGLNNVLTLVGILAKIFITTFTFLCRIIWSILDRVCWFPTCTQSTWSVWLDLSDQNREL